MEATVLASLHATALTTRCHNPFFRHDQLKALHDTLRNEIDSLRSAIRQDTSCTDVEATIEIATGLALVKEHYASIDPKKELENEYRPAHEVGAQDRMEPWGVVFVEPNLGHTSFLSVLEPLSAAIAAGNCVALKLETTTRAVPSLLRSLLAKALQPDTFQIVSTTPSKEALANAFVVSQEARTSYPTHNQLVSSPGRVVSVVDRTADLSAAAEALVAARFGFGGTSPYAPDLVFVNEFVKTAFVEQVLSHAIRYLAVTSSNGSSSPTQAYQSKGQATSKALSSLTTHKDWDMSIITQGSAGAIVELTNKHTTHIPLPPKSNASILAISPISSLDHVIDLLVNDPEERLRAAYHFAAPAHAKYLSQFILAEATFVNHIPSDLLLGPAAPLYHAVDVSKRYTKEQFLRNAPVFVEPRRSTHSFDVSSREASKLLQNATKEIAQKKRAEWIAIGFFEQGILIGLGMYGIPVLTCIGASLFFGVRAGLRRFAVI